MAAQRVCLQNTWMSTGSSGVWELTESTCPPQSFLPLLICGFQPCHSAFHSNFHRVSNTHQIPSQRQPFSQLQLFLYFGTGWWVSCIRHWLIFCLTFPLFDTVFYKAKMQHMSWRPSISCTLQGAFLSAFLFLGLVDSLQHHIMHLHVLLWRSSGEFSLSPAPQWLCLLAT